MIQAKKMLSTAVAIVLMCTLCWPVLAYGEPDQATEPPTEQVAVQSTEPIAAPTIESAVAQSTEPIVGQSIESTKTQSAIPLAIVDGTPINEVFTGEDGILAKWVAELLGKEVTDGVDAADLADIEELIGDKFPAGDRSQFRDWAGIENLTGLKKLLLSGCSLVDSNLSTLAGAPALAQSLVELDISASHIKGDLASVKDYTNLTNLDFNLARALTGELSSLASLDKVESFRIGGNGNVTGALLDLNELASLSRFQLAATNVSGDLGDLGAHPNLAGFKAIWLPQTSNIFGDVAVFAPCTVLEEFAIYEAVGQETDRITGSLDFLGNSTELKNVIVNSTALTGTLENIFAKSKGLDTVAINSPSVGGSLSALSGMSGLKTANLLNASIGGSIVNLKDSKWLAELSVNSKAVNGALGELLPSLMEIKQFNVGGTSVTGTLADIGTRGAYQHINIAGVGITGDLNDLKETFTKSAMLVNLNLSDNPAITGDVALLGELAQGTAFSGLSQLNLSNTAIGGDIASLVHIKSLVDVRLSGSKVFGDIGALDALENLENIEAESLRIDLPALVFFDEPQAVGIPVLYKGDALDPKDIKGGAGKKTGNTLVWDVPTNGSGALSYAFELQGSLMKASFTYSGTVSQEYVKLAKVYQFIDEQGKALDALPKVTDASLKYTVRVNAEFNRFINDQGEQVGGVLFNNRELKMDVEYSGSDGSTVITLQPSVFKGLANGDYSLTVYFSDGYARSDVPVSIGGPTPGPTPNPTPAPTPKPGPLPVTGDSATAWQLFTTIALAGVFLIAIYRRKLKG